MNARTLASLAALSALAAAAPGLARAADGAPPPASTTRLTVLLGAEAYDEPVGFQLRGDLELGERRLSSAFAASLLVSLGWTWFHGDAGELFQAVAGEQRLVSSLHLLRLAPAARLSLGSPSARAYLDAGVGLVYGVGVLETGGGSGTADAGLHGFLRFAAGGSVQVSRSLALGAELGLLPFLPETDEATLSLLASATFRL